MREAHFRRSIRIEKINHENRGAPRPRAAGSVRSCQRWVPCTNRFPADEACCIKTFDPAQPGSAFVWSLTTLRQQRSAASARSRRDALMGARGAGPGSLVLRDGSPHPCRRRQKMRTMKETARPVRALVFASRTRGTPPARAQISHCRVSDSGGAEIYLRPLGSTV